MLMHRHTQVRVGKKPEKSEKDSDRSSPRSVLALSTGAILSHHDGHVVSSP